MAEFHVGDSKDTDEGLLLLFGFIFIFFLLVLTGTECNVMGCTETVCFQIQFSISENNFDFLASDGEKVGN